MKKFTKLLSLILALAMVGSLAACGSSSGTADSSADSAAAAGDTAAGDTAAADSGEVYTLSLTMHDPVTSSIGVLYQEWADEVSAATDGHVVIQLYGSGTLAAGTEAVDFVKSGAADIGWIYTSFYSGQFPITEVVTIPMSGLYHPAQTANVLWDLYEETPEMQDELSGFKVLMLYGNPVNFFSTKSTPVVETADLQGLNLRCPSGGVAEVLQSLGVNTILMNSNDIYEGLEKGTIDGTVHEWNGISTFSLNEQLNYYMDVALYEGVFVLGMNLDKWNSLPAEYQEAIESVSLRDGSVKIAEGFNDAAMEHKDEILANGGTLVEISDDLNQALTDASRAYGEEWAASVTTDTFDGEAYYQRMLELAEQYATY